MPRPGRPVRQKAYSLAVSTAVFLDRDDTLIACRSVTPDGDLGDPDLVRLLDGALEACRMLHEAGFRLVVVSNQGGVARGRYSVEDVERVNSRVNELLGGVIDAFYFCPYHPRGTTPQYTREHPLRKPQPGMLLQGAEDLGIDLADSWMVGDQERDCLAGRAAGCRTILIAQSPPEDPACVDFVAPDVLGAAREILRIRTGA